MTDRDNEIFTIIITLGFVAVFLLVSIGVYDTMLVSTRADNLAVKLEVESCAKLRNKFVCNTNNTTLLVYATTDFLSSEIKDCYVLSEHKEVKK